MHQSSQIGLRASQRLSLNSGLYTAIRLLQADSAGLTAFLEEAAAENPALRLDPPPPPRAGDWPPRWGRFLPVTGGQPLPDTAPSAGPSLMAHVMAQIDRRFSAPQDRRIALALAEALEPSGWLGQRLDQIATRLSLPLARVEAVLLCLQETDPAGLFARDLAECLRLQAQEEGILDPVMQVVLDHLDLLAKGDFARLATLARPTVPTVTKADIDLCFRRIRRMNPKPGAAFDSLSSPHHRDPDLLVQPLPDGGFEVALNHSSLPSLRLDAEAAKARPADLTAARGIVQMVDQRNATLLRVGRAILQRQSAALATGPSALVPLTMAEVAAELDLHESTISRVVAGTSVDTPHGTWWLRALFSRGLGPAQMSGAALRDALSRLIAAEDSQNPISDQDLASALSQDGAEIARRTVAKYRNLLRIPPAHRRRTALRGQGKA